MDKSKVPIGLPSERSLKLTRFNQSQLWDLAEASRSKMDYVTTEPPTEQ